MQFHSVSAPNVYNRHVGGGKGELERTRITYPFRCLHVEYIISEVNQRLGLLRRMKHSLPLTVRQLFYNSLVLPVFDYADLVWGDKNNVTLLNDLQFCRTRPRNLSLTGHFIRQILMHS